MPTSSTVRALVAEAAPPTRPDATRLRLGRRFVEALVDRDFDAIERLFAPDVRFRAVIPSRVETSSSADGARSIVAGWFDDTDQAELVSSSVEDLVDRLQVAYRIHGHEVDGWYMVEQHLSASIQDDHLTDVAMLCSGFRPAQGVSGSGSPHETGPQLEGDIRPDGRLDALGRSCSTLTPTLRAAVLRLPPGGVLELLADDPTADASLLAWTRLTGHEYVGYRSGPGAASRYYIRRRSGGAVAPATAAEQEGSRWAR
jgi:tRNA 2-thiouridine synthesizing protein A